MCVWLNLRLLSNIGLLGMPNAGKSTFLDSTTSAKPKIATFFTVGFLKVLIL